MGTMHLQLNETEVKALLLMIHAASEVDWRNKETREAMIHLTAKIQTSVTKHLPFLATFLEDKQAAIGTF